MERIAWVTDSTAYLDGELKGHPDVYWLPMTIQWEDREYRDGIDLSPEEFFQKLESSSVPPKSSQPSVGAFIELFQSLQENYDVIIAIHLSSKLSGTYSSSLQASKMVDLPVHVVDSEILSYPLTKIILAAMEKHREGKTAEEIVSAIQELPSRNETFVLIGSLEQLHRSGRMNHTQFFLGSLLNVKPIIALKNGVLSVREKVRTEKKAEARMISLFTDAYDQGGIKEVGLLYGLNPEKANQWKATLEEKYPDLRIGTYPLGTVIGVHAGKDTIGISWFRE